MPYLAAFPESPPAELHVVGLDLQDALDDLFTLELWVHSERADLAARDYVGRPVTLVVPSFGAPLRVHGVVARMIHERTEPTGVSRYRFTARPWLWLTTHRQNSRIFQDQSVLDVLVAIADDYAGRIPPFAEELAQPVPPVDFMAQYAESDWAMIRRRTADRGLSLRAIHDGSGAVAISDDPASFGERVALRYRPLSELVPADPLHVIEASFDSTLVPGGVEISDYDYERPLLPLQGRARSRSALGTEELLVPYEHGVGRIVEESAQLAALRLEEARAERRRATFRVTVAAAPGTIIRLAEHPRDDENRDWLVVRARTQASDETASHLVEAIPAEHPYRPRRPDPPRVMGTQTAVVVGREGEEIDVDAQGRVCVLFRWDRRDKHHDTTRRVRISQGWAVGGYGLVCLPRIGDEVIVDFLNGDPDQPIVVGAVHNPVRPSPLELPEQKTVTTLRSRTTPGGAGFNELSFDDAAGAERVYLHAQRDAVVEVENDVHTRIEGNVYGQVAGSTSGGVQGSSDVSIAGDGSLAVGGVLSVNAGDVHVNGRNHIMLAAPGMHQASDNHFIACNGLWVRAGSVTQFVTGKLHVFAGEIMLQAGGSTIKMDGGGVEINGPIIKLNC
jgi:type VI secretion system secreted protein VgrG